MRILLSLLAALIATAALAQGTPTLKREVTVAGEIVRIGDLIENAGPAATAPVFRAPDLGTTGAVPARQIIEAARAHGLTIVDAFGIDTVAVTRAAHVLGPKDIELRIARALGSRHKLGDIENISIAFDRDVRTLTLDAASPFELQIARLSYDGSSRRFDLTFELTHAQGQRNYLRYTGTAVETVEAAVLNRPLGRGEVIKAGDVTLERRPKSELNGEAQARPEEVVGLALKRAVRASQPLRVTDLMKPLIIQKNEIVTLVHQMPGVLLHLRVKALDTGAEGDVINVQNLQSKRVIQGTVTGPGRVTFNSPVSAAPAAPAPRLAAQVPADPSGAVRR